MVVFRVIFEMSYPGAEEDIRTAYVLAHDFGEAKVKVEKQFKEIDQSANVKVIEYLNKDYIIV